MKQTITLLVTALLMMAGVQTAQAQMMLVRLTNNQVVNYDITQVESVAFVDGYVDLGLPSGTLWASCNVGANSPEEAGDYFAWGETQTKDNYGWGNYFDSSFVKYNVDGGLTELLPEDDAATVNLNAGWQMPSKAQIDELMNSSNTITVWMKQNGVDGFMVISRNNSNYIFLPAAGFCWGEGVNAIGSDGYYWTRSLSQDRSNAAEIMYFTSSGMQSIFSTRAMGFSIRPVVSQILKHVTEITLDYTSLTLTLDATQQITATILPEDATYKAVTWKSSDAAVATVSSDGLVEGKSEGTCTITCSATDGSGIFAECQVTVYEHEFVDLGLPSGTLWATMNIGANSPEEEGDSFRWGETKPYDRSPDKTYKFYADYTYLAELGLHKCKLTKYCSDAEVGYEGFTDNLWELEPEDDAATVNWGSNWQMPSKEQVEELGDKENTKIIRKTQNGVEGLLVTSKTNNNSIFLPEECWTRSKGLDQDNGDCSFAYHMINKINNVEIYSRQDYRHYKFCVRPVRKP